MIGTTPASTALLSSLALAGLACGLLACGGDSSATDVSFGETTVVIVINPAINDANEAGNIPLPGRDTAGLTVSSDDGISNTSDGNGVAVLTGLEAGRRTITISGNGIDASTVVQITEGELRELSAAVINRTFAIMSNVGITSEGTVIEIESTMSAEEVNDALDTSNVVLFFRGGTYEGDLDFSGSDAILFGEGARGGQVIFTGNVQVTGSRSRIRGATVQGTLSLPASNSSLSFSRIEGSTTVDGSDAVLLQNQFCGGATVNGSGVTAVGNLGLAPYGDC